MACGVHAREIEESTITSVLNECLRDFPHIGALRKERKTCLVNLARGKDVFVILPTGFGLASQQSSNNRTVAKSYLRAPDRFTLSLDLFRRTSWS